VATLLTARVAPWSARRGTVIMDDGDRRRAPPAPGSTPRSGLDHALTGRAAA
jgi:hypothetical protein